jgi:hypothetical protein
MNSNRENNVDNRRSAGFLATIFVAAFLLLIFLIVTIVVSHFVSGSTEKKTSAAMSLHRNHNLGGEGTVG